MLRINPEERWPSMKVVRDILSELDIAESPNDQIRKQVMTSYLRIQGHGVEAVHKFFGRFYENLFSALPEVKPHFESIDMERQYRILNRAIHTLLEFCSDSQMAKQNLEDLALRHASLGLTLRRYNIFLDTLVKTIGELGNDNLDQLAAWRTTLEPGIDFMWKCQKKHQARGSQPTNRTSRPKAKPNRRAQKSSAK